MSPRGLDLLFDEIKVIEQPFTGWRNRPVRLGGCRKKTAGLFEYSFVVGKSRQKLVMRAAGSDRVLGRQPFTMLLHLRFTEQL